ncbi:MAG TPA: S8 family serine peptidase [Candidatus Paceibacterota bacterium]
MKKYLFYTLAVVFVAGTIVSAKGPDTVRPKSQTRFIVHTESEAALGLERACARVKNNKALIVLQCDDVVGQELGLQEDIRVFAADAGANTQIGANIVQGGGNTGSSTKIAILDTGYNYLHSELSSSYSGGYDFVNNDNDPMDDNGHGSHVGGLIAADGINTSAKGVAPDAAVVALKVLDLNGSGFFSDVVEAIYWAVNGPDNIFGNGDESGIAAMNLSLGTGKPYVYKGFCDSILPDLTNAIKYAREHNILVAVAAGNEGRAGVSLPGCISYSTTVGAVNSSDQIASFSGRGSALDIVAPGVSLFGPWLGTSYVTISGTSMATPIITGVAALVHTAHPTYSAVKVEEALIKTAKNLGKAGKDNDSGWGRVRANNAVTY